MRKVIEITKLAGNKLQEIAKKNNTNSLLFYVKGGGCNGFNYKFEPFYKTPNKYDIVVPYKDIEVIVCGKSMIYLIGTTIDWKTDIMGDSFNFENPNANSKCGCGTSFSPNIDE